jgi:catechol 2,3-dioxygenase-like lactoylglutathione lyase family enzyme
VEYRLELVLLPVADIDRAKAFYTDQCGFHLDVDTSPTEQFRVVQLTPPGSHCSISFGKGLVDTAPGSVRGLHLVVADIEQAHAELTARGLAISPIRHFADGAWQAGPDPQRRTYHSFADFSDPDGNSWVLQEVRRA